jgi:tRNA1Val (adenine37-N6)-methyltransferase
MRRPERAVDSSDEAAEAGLSQDALFSGQVTLFQPRRGYKVTVDTLLLADFAASARPEARHVVDLGAGVGALALAYAHFAAVGRCSLVEREAPLASIAERNLAAARLPGAAIVTDLARGLPEGLSGQATVVLSNPPFFQPHAASDDSLRKRARGGELSPFLRAAARAMASRAYAFFVYPAPALSQLLAAAHAATLVAKRARFVHAFAGSPARVVLVELRRAKPGGLVVEAPLIEWAAEGRRSPEVLRIVRGEPRLKGRAGGPE